MFPKTYSVWGGLEGVVFLNLFSRGMGDMGGTGYLFYKLYPILTSTTDREGKQTLIDGRGLEVFTSMLDCTY